MSELSKITATFKAEIGYLEKKSNKNLDSKSANAGFNNYTKYNRDMKKIRKAGTLTDYWCANFVSWCYVKAFGTKRAKELLGTLTNYVPYLYNSFKKRKRTSHTPHVGDVIFFRNCAHVGQVIKVSKSHVWTIEGNTTKSGFHANGGCVAPKKYSRRSSWIFCYGRPEYKKVVAKKKTSKVAVKKSVTKTIKNIKKKTVNVSKYPLLKKGSKGKYVKKLQKLLKIKADGIFGSSTETAVKEFQKKKGLTADGQVGQKTWKKLLSK